MPALDYTPEANIAPVRSRCVKQLRPLPVSAWATGLNRLHGNGLHRRWWQFRLAVESTSTILEFTRGSRCQVCAQSVCGKASN
jgi:hypothetical protein